MVKEAKYHGNEYFPERAWFGDYFGENFDFPISENSRKHKNKDKKKVKELDFLEEDKDVTGLDDYE